MTVREKIKSSGVCKSAARLLQIWVFCCVERSRAGGLQTGVKSQCVHAARAACGAFIFTPSTPLSRRRQAGRRVETLPPLCNRDCVNSAFCLLTKRLFNQTSVSTEPAFVAAGHMFLPLPKLNLPEFEILHVRRIHHHPPPTHPLPPPPSSSQ